VEVKGRLKINKIDHRDNGDSIWNHVVLVDEYKSQYYGQYYSDIVESFLNTGDIVDIRGKWKINKKKQRDGTYSYFNYVEIKEIKHVKEEVEPW